MCWRKEFSPSEQKCQDTGREVFESVLPFKGSNNSGSLLFFPCTDVLIETLQTQRFFE